MNMQEIFSIQKSAFNTYPTLSVDERIAILTRLEEMILHNKIELCKAVSSDFSIRSIDETLLCEIIPIINGIRYTKEKIKDWMQPISRDVNAFFGNIKAQVEYQPVGVVGIISPWNYPINLTLSPLIAALSAGNRVMIKPSEYVINTASLLKELVDTFFLKEEVSVILDYKDLATEFSRLPFGHLLFTGSSKVGREVMKNAAKNLTPVTLELGGKSPAIIDRTCDLRSAIEKIVIAKMTNAGQACVAPDYLFVPVDKLDLVIDYIKKVFPACYPRLEKNNEYTSIINEIHYKRLLKYIDEAKMKGADILTLGSEIKKLSKNRQLPFTLILNVKKNMSVMREEIFGPLLPIITYDKFDEVIKHIKHNGSPLAIYYFGKPTNRIEQLKIETQSGALCINSLLIQATIDDLPFGGVGESGFGRYHGKEGFINFSNIRSVLTSLDGVREIKMKPPYLGKVNRYFDNVINFKKNKDKPIQIIN